MNALYRSSVLAVANFRPLRSLIERRGMQMGVRRFVAGEDFADAAPAIDRLEEQGFAVILDVLGEFVDNEAAALQITENVIETVQRMASREHTKQLSVKLTQLGLGISKELGLNSMRRVAHAAREAGVQVAMDMENHPYIDATLEILETLHDEGYTNVSTVLQAYLHRTQEDLGRLLAMPSKPAVRIVKGAYKEPAAISYQQRSVISDKFHEMVVRTLEAGSYANIATHDERLVARASEYIEQNGVNRDQYEFQMLYGVMPGLQKRLLEQGHTVRIYVPFGQDWYGYFSRRLAEKPGNLAFVARGLFG